MTNEEFQRLVLEKLDKLDERMSALEGRQDKLEIGQEQIIKELRGVVEQTADLMEFRYEVKEESADIKANISRIEIATADNWSDIARLKSIRHL